MLEAVDLGSLLWDEFKTGANVPGKSHSGLQNRGSAPTTLRSFQLDASCGEHVLDSIGFQSNSHLGMSATCTAASTYGNAVEKTLPLPGSITITSESEGTCMSIHRIVPWRLKVRQADNGNVYIHTCHDGLNQQWYMLDGNIISVHDNKCLDAHLGTKSRAGRAFPENVYMHECHDGANQKWYWDEDTAQIRSEHDHRCLDMSLDGNNNIYMRSPHTLPGDFKWDSNEKKIINLVSNKCLEARGRGRVDEVSCTQRIEQEWAMSHGLPGFVDAPIACPGDQVISYVKKTSWEVKYRCSHVSSLGACTPHFSQQVETTSSDIEHNKALRKLGAFCPPGEGLKLGYKEESDLAHFWKSMEAEASDKGTWIRLRYECCQISRVPISIYPYLTGGARRAFDGDMAQGWEGVYCPSTRDDSGRMSFSQRRSFRPLHGAHETLTYDKHHGKWCVSGKDCAHSDVVHPLDTSLHSEEWYVVPVSDFDAIFEAKGAKPLAAAKKKKPPPLIKFGASDPDYLPECKDESHPGARKFKLAEMNKEAKNLDDENPCKNVYGVPPTNQKMDNSDGMTGWINDLTGNIGPGQGGVTYKSVKECSDRDIVRELQMAKWNKDHFDTTLPMDFLKDMLAGYADGVPDVEELKGFLRSVEKHPPPKYQALEAMLIGICIACFCLDGSSDEEESIRALTVEDATNLIFCLEYLSRAWANGFSMRWFFKGSSVIDLLSCLPIVEKVASLDPSSEMSLELTLLRSVRFLRIFRLLKSTAMVEDRNGRKRRSLSLSVMRILVSAVGTLSISAGLLWRVEGKNGINPSINSFGDALFYMLNVFTSQGAPFPVMSTQGRFVTAAAILIGVLSLPVQVSELLSLLRSMKQEEERERVNSIDSCIVLASGSSAAAVAAVAVEEAPSEKLDAELTVPTPTADSLGSSASGFLGISVEDFCREAGVESTALGVPILDADVGDFFTVLEDVSTAEHVVPEPRSRVKLLAALVRRKRLYKADMRTKSPTG
eukprot:s1765_g3.t1